MQSHVEFRHPNTSSIGFHLSHSTYYQASHREAPKIMDHMDSRRNKANSWHNSNPLLQRYPLNSNQQTRRKDRRMRLVLDPIQHRRFPWNGLKLGYNEVYGLVL